MIALPKGWSSKRILDVTVPFQTVDPGREPDRQFKYIDISAIDNSTQTVRECKTIYGKDAPSRARRLVRSGDILFSTVRTNLRNIAIVPDELDGAIASTGLAVLRCSSEVDRRYLFNWVCSDVFVTRISKAQDGTMYPAIRDSDLYEASVALPSFTEQQRIITKLDSVIASLRYSFEELVHIPVLADRYRRAIFDAAVTGALTADWRAGQEHAEWYPDFLTRIKQERPGARTRGRKQSHDLQDKSLAPSLSDGHLPENWHRCQIADIVECLDYKRVPINKAERIKRPGSVPYYGANGPVGWIDDFLFDEDLVLVVEDETFVGRTKPFSYVVRGRSWVNNHAHVLRPLGGVSVDFLNVILSYYDFIPLTSGTTGRRKLTQDALMKATMVIPPPLEQVEIMRKVEAATSRVETLLSEQSRAAILVKRLIEAARFTAFRGQLGALEAQTSERHRDAAE